MTFNHLKKHMLNRKRSPKTDNLASLMTTFLEQTSTEIEFELEECRKIMEGFSPYFSTQYPQLFPDKINR